MNSLTWSRVKLHVAELRGMLGDAEQSGLLLLHLLILQYISSKRITTSTRTSNTTSTTLRSLDMVDQDQGDVDPEEPAHRGDARVMVAGSGLAVLLAASRDGKELGSGVDIAFDERIECNAET